MGQRSSSPLLVGRMDQLEYLGASLDAVIAGRSETVLVAGEAGIGKTRLVREFCERAIDRGALVGTGACVPIDGGGLPYGAMTAIVRDLARRTDESVLVDLAQSLRSGTGLGRRDTHRPGHGYSAVPSVVDDMAKTRLFESVLSCVTTLAQRSPLIVVFDDVQWADSASADLITFFTRNLLDAPVLVIATYRTGDIERDHRLRPWLTELLRDERVTQLRVDALGRRETATMIEAMIEESPDPAFVDAVWARSQGNPFFAEVLTANRADRSLPDELKDLILGRIDALSADAQLVVQVVAVAEVDVEHRLVTALDMLEPSALDRAVEEAVAKQMLVVDPTGAGYRLRHALLREAVDASLLPGGRARIHRQLASAIALDPTLVAIGPGHRAAALAVHWWGAGEWNLAVDASVAAADTALAVWAFPEAQAHLERALAALDRTSPAPSLDSRLALLEKASDAAYLADDGQRSVDLAREAIALATGTVDDPTVARYHALLGRNAWSLGDTKLAFDAYRAATALVPADPPSVDLARVLAEEARGLMLMSRHVEAAAHGREALTVALAVGARAEEGHIRYTLGCAEAMLGGFEDGIALVREAMAIAEEMSSADDLNRAYLGLGSLLMDSGRLEEAAALVFDSAAVGQERWGVRLNGAAYNSVSALIRLGRYDDADAVLAEAGDRGVGNCAPYLPLLRATVATRRGRFGDASRLLAVTDELSSRLTDVQTRGLFHLEMAVLALAQGRLDDAELEIERGFAIAVGTDDLFFVSEMCALAVRVVADRYDDARASGRECDLDKLRLVAVGYEQRLQRVTNTPPGDVALVAPRLEIFRRMCAAEHSRLYASDAELWDGAATAAERAREAYLEAYCRWRQAEALLASRAGRSRAVDALQRAWTVAMRIQARPLMDRIEALARRARLMLECADEVEPSAADHVASDLGLTPREVEVLRQLAHGRTDREIADLLFISKKTASVHVSNILRKLEVPNRFEAGRIGQSASLD